MSKKALNRRARKIWIRRHGDPICWCGAPADVHHKDGNQSNNEDSNLEPLCRPHHIAHENKLSPKRKQILSDYESAVIADYVSGLTLREVGKKYGAGEKTVQEFLIRRGIKRRSTGPRPRVGELAYPPA